MNSIDSVDMPWLTVVTAYPCFPPTCTFAGLPSMASILGVERVLTLVLVRSASRAAVNWWRVPAPMMMLEKRPAPESGTGEVPPVPEDTALLNPPVPILTSPRTFSQLTPRDISSVNKISKILASIITCLGWTSQTWISFSTFLMFSGVSSTITVLEGLWILTILIPGIADNTSWILSISAYSSLKIRICSLLASGSNAALGLNT